MEKSTAEVPAAAPAQASVGLSDRTTLLAFGTFVVISGGAFVAIRFTYGELPPFWGAAARFLCGALFFWAIKSSGNAPKQRYKIWSIKR